MQRFARLARSPSPRLDGLLLALAAEFHRVDESPARRALGQLSAGLGSAATRPPREQAAMAGDLLGYAAGLRLARDRRPDGLLLDCVLFERTGEPAALAAVYSLAAHAAGMPLRVAIAGRRWLVTHAGGGPLVLDPAQSGALLEPDELPGDLRTPGPHEIAFEILNELIDAHALAGDLRRATQAAELRLVLPIPARLRERAAAEVRGLRASLN